MIKQRPIRLSKWYLRNKKKKSDIVIVSDILVCGDKEDVPEIMKDSLYLNRVYRDFNKSGSCSKKEEYEVARVELGDKIFGYESSSKIRQ